MSKIAEEAERLAGIINDFVCNHKEINEWCHLIATNIVAESGNVNPLEEGTPQYQLYYESFARLQIQLLSAAQLGLAIGGVTKPEIDTK